jgi:hypothetical protein
MTKGTVKYEYDDERRGIKEAPRFPKFIGFLEAWDL